MKKIDKLIAEGTDEEVLTEFYKFLQRVTISTDFLTDEDGLIRGEAMVVSSGDLSFSSEPYEYPWPLQYMPMPDALKGSLN